MRGARSLKLTESMVLTKVNSLEIRQKKVSSEAFPRSSQSSLLGDTSKNPTVVSIPA